MRELRLRAALECGKLDLQLMDRCALANRPVLLSPRAWEEIASSAELLAAEALQIEETILDRPELLRELGLPGSVRRALAADRRGARSPECRVWRFDFHWTSTGWRISEVNSDVPGGFLEASAITRLYLEHVPGCTGCGDPTERVCDAIAKATGADALLALVHATSFSDDRQVMMHLARAFERAGGRAHLASPRQVRMTPRGAWMRTSWYTGRVDAVMRFYPAEWLPSLGLCSGWQSYFRSNRVPQMNPGHAIVSQSKRCPLLWDRLGLAVPTWRRLLPETVDPRDAGFRQSESWVLKPALGRVGEGVLVAGVVGEMQAADIRRDALRNPGQWVAQRRFESVPPRTGSDSSHVCIGVFVVGSRAAGAYGRIASAPLIDWRAQETGVLIRPD